MTSRLDVRLLPQRNNSLLRFPFSAHSSVGNGIRICCAGSSGAISASPSSARDRRKGRNERREQGKVSWRAELEEKEMEKKKAVPKGLKYELDMSRVTARGMQWWMVLVSMRAELSMAESISSTLTRDLPGEDFEVFVPSIPTKRKLKDGNISNSTQRLHAGCVFLRCVLSRKIHDAVKRIPRVKGFFGKKVGYLEEVIMPIPVPAEDIEKMQKKIREEEIDLCRLQELAKEERKKEKEASEKDTLITIGSNIRIVSGPYANFEGSITGLPDGNREGLPFSLCTHLRSFALLGGFAVTETSRLGKLNF